MSYFFPESLAPPRRSADVTPWIVHGPQVAPRRSPGSSPASFHRKLLEIVRFRVGLHRSVRGLVGLANFRSTSWRCAPPCSIQQAKEHDGTETERAPGSGRARHLQAAERQLLGLRPACRQAALPKIGPDLDLARHARLQLTSAVRMGEVPVSPHRRFRTVRGCGSSALRARWPQVSGGRGPWRRTGTTSRVICSHRWAPAGSPGSLSMTLPSCWTHFGTGAARRRPRPTRWRRSRASCGSRAAEDGSRPIRLSGSSAMSARGRSAAASACLGVGRSNGCWARSPGPGRLMIASALYTGLRISEMLGLIWDDVDLAAGLLHVRAQLTRAHRREPARRVRPILLRRRRRSSHESQATRGRGE